MLSNPNSGRSRRIRHESQKAENWTLGDERGLGVVTTGEEEENLRKCFLVDISFPADYPFKPPKLTIHDTETSVITLLRHHPISAEIRELTGFDCLCCAYVECKDLWSPVMTVNFVLKQLKRFLNFKKRALERYLCKKITIKNNIPIPPYGGASILDFL